jgi:RNA polymerase subunit RPABC4/transcription elongation factor Spt4
MRTHCPACRNTLPADAEICAACGAFFNDGFTGYRGRPMFLLIGRWSAVASWIGQAFAVLVGALNPRWPDFLAFLESFIGVPLGLLVLLMAVRLRHRALGMLGVVFIAQSCFIVWLIDATILFSRQLDWSVIGLSGSLLVLTGPFVYWFWHRPVPPADFLACRNCGYLLRGLVVPRCPECGTPFDVRKLTRLSSHLPVRPKAKRPDAPISSRPGGPGSS